MFTAWIAAAAQTVADADHLTLAEVVADIPHDLPAVVVYVMLAVSVGLIWRVNRPKKKA